MTYLSWPPPNMNSIQVVCDSLGTNSLTSFFRNNRATGLLRWAQIRPVRDYLQSLVWFAQGWNACSISLWGITPVYYHNYQESLQLAITTIRSHLTKMSQISIYFSQNLIVAMSIGRNWRNFWLRLKGWRLILLVKKRIANIGILLYIFVLFLQFQSFFCV